MTTPIEGPLDAVDARRLAWCRSRVLWTHGVFLTTFEEDIEGTVDEGQQHGLALVTRWVAEQCAIALDLMLHHTRPLPPVPLRAMAAARRLADQPTAGLLLEVLRGEHADDPVEELAAHCRTLIDHTLTVIGDVPQILDPDGRLRALGEARDWIGFLELVGEEGGEFLPDYSSVRS